MTATVRNLFILIREGWPAEACSKKMVNFIKRWPATARILFLLLREGRGWPRPTVRKWPISLRDGQLQ